jgi:hypothetical protein
MFNLHCSQKLLDRLGTKGVVPTESSTNILGNWYAKVIFTKPQVALFVNERTLLPVLMPFAPATNLVERFPHYLFKILLAHGMNQAFIENEINGLGTVNYCKATNRSTIGTLNIFTEHLAYSSLYQQTGNLFEVSMELSDTPCGPLYKSSVTPGNALLEFASSGRIH